MTTLYRFEDTYGMFDLFSLIRVGHLQSNKVIKRLELDSNTIVEYGIGFSRIFDISDKLIYQYKKSGIDKIVFVFDSDNECGDKTKLISEGYFLEAVSSLKDRFLFSGANIQVGFVLNVFAFETVMFYQTLHGSDFNIDSLVHKEDTNRFQNILLAYQYDIHSVKDLKSRIRTYIDKSSMMFESARLCNDLSIINNDILSWVSSGCSSDFRFCSDEDVLEKIKRANSCFEFYKSNPRQFYLHGEVSSKHCLLSTDMSLQAIHSIL